MTDAALAALTGPALGALAGVCLGAAYCAALRRAVVRAARATRRAAGPAAWLAATGLARVGAVSAALALLFRVGAAHGVAGLAGFALARTLVVRRAALGARREGADAAHA